MVLKIILSPTFYICFIILFNSKSISLFLMRINLITLKHTTINSEIMCISLSIWISYRMHFWKVQYKIFRFINSVPLRFNTTCVKDINLNVFYLNWYLKNDIRKSNWPFFSCILSLFLSFKLVKIFTENGLNTMWINL